MKLAELKTVVTDNVCIYKEISGADYEDLYKGKMRDVPEKLLDYEVWVV